MSAYLVDHVTFGMPTLVPRVAVDFNKLLQDSTAAAYAFGGKAGRIVVMAVNVVVMLVI